MIATNARRSKRNTSFHIHIQIRAFHLPINKVWLSPIGQFDTDHRKKNYKTIIYLMFVSVVSVTIITGKEEALKSISASLHYNSK